MAVFLQHSLQKMVNMPGCQTLIDGLINQFNPGVKSRHHPEVTMIINECAPLPRETAGLFGSSCYAPEVTPPCTWTQITLLKQALLKEAKDLERKKG